ncbi:hypothetical protein [Actinoplanes flavus]|uniref:SMODS and SLOG-associating 2TM effector domain-containing protein n=1 Tax=Actinoplanes flavus TaxID=2820290 RepID=A0ABS3UFJ3_9ACTN|nr:hypothetical protein [Actinoplanes flavus]MBO3737539.1 hypothetical protein [Actinoplanes flavus]
MTFDALSDVELQRFEHDVLHRPEEARKTLTKWAGLVWYQDRYGERYGVPSPDPSGVALTRERLHAVIRARLPHLNSEIGNGRSCDCRYLKVAIAAFDRERLATTQRRYVTASTAAISCVFATAALVLAFWFLDDATSLTSDRAFGFIAGVSGGLVVATIQLVFAITTGLTERVAQTVEWAGFHPDSDWHLLGTLNPRHRRMLRHAHLRRAAEVVLRPSPHAPASTSPPARSLTTRLSRAYRAFRSNN